MRMIRQGHYQTTVAYGHYADIVVNVIKVESRYQHKITRWQLTIADTFVPSNNVKLTYKSKAECVKKAWEEVQDILQNDTINRVKKAFPELYKKGKKDGKADEQSDKATERTIPSEAL